MHKETKIITALVVAFLISYSLGNNVFSGFTPRFNPGFISSLSKNITSIASSIPGISTLIGKAVTGSTQRVGAPLFSWYYCPPDGRTCIPDLWAFKSPGAVNPYPNEGGTYNPNNYWWWKVEAADMTCAGLDTAYIYIWDKDAQYFNHLDHLLQAIADISSPLKIAEYWDASYASGDGGPVDLSLPETAQYRYETYIKPFYQKIPKDLWETRDGKPILMVYRFGTDSFTGTDHADSFFKSIKTLFAADFGSEPFLILSTTWFNSSNAGTVADGQNEMFQGTIACTGNAASHTVNGFTTTTISAGGVDYRDFGCHLNRSDDTVLKNGYNQVPENNNLLMIESWNELGEGSGIERAIDYPKNDGGVLPETFYLDSLRTLLGRSDRGPCKTLDELMADTGAHPNPTSPPGQNPTAPPGQNPTSPPGQNPTSPPGQNPTSPPAQTAGTVEIRIHNGSETGPLFSEATGKISVYLEGPTANGHRFGETLTVSGKDESSCKSKGGFPYTCKAGIAQWKGADGTSGTTAGSYRAVILSAPTGWTIQTEVATGTLSGSSLTLDLSISK